MSSTKFNVVNSKNYTAIRKLNVNISKRVQLKNYAVQKKMLSIATLLNNINNFSTKGYKVRKTPIVFKYKMYFDDYMKGDYVALGNATKLMSFFLYDIMPKRNIIGNKLSIFRGKSFNEINSGL